MTELQLFKWFASHEPEHRWEGKKENDDVIAWIRFSALDSFTALIGYNVLSEGGIECRLQEGCVAINMRVICEHHDIVLENIFDKN